MNNTNIFNEFDILLLSYTKGQLEPYQKRKLLEYLETSDIYRKRFEEVTQLYAISTTPIFEERREANFIYLKKQLHLNTTRSIKKEAWLWKVAVSIVAIIVTASISYLVGSISFSQSDTSTPQYCNVETVKGSKTRVTLADSTIVNLNENSSLKYDAQFSTNKVREVKLLGEAHFDVKKTDQQTFVVRLGQVSIEVLGTTFMVASNSSDSTATVSLIEGSVKMFSDQDSTLQVVLTPGEQAIYNRNQKTLNTQVADLAAVTSWMRGRLVFTNKPLYEILKDIESEYNIKFVIKTSQIAEEYFTGSIDTSLEVEQVLKHLDVDKKYRWIKEGRKITLTNR